MHEPAEAKSDRLTPTGATVYERSLTDPSSVEWARLTMEDITEQSQAFQDYTKGRDSILKGRGILQTELIQTRQVWKIGTHWLVGTGWGCTASPN